MVEILEALDEFERLIEFETVFNFRDLGGYPTRDGRETRWRRLFRADGLNRLKRDDGVRFGNLGIATVVDLRTPDEAEASRFTDSFDDVAYHHLPMFDVMPDWEAGDPDADGYLADRYAEMLRSGQAAVARTLELLASEASYPLVFHCAAGKDRTGIVAAIVLEILGVDDEVIVGDYAMSGEAMQRLIAWAQLNQGSLPAKSRPVPSAAIESHPDTMRRFLAHLRHTFGEVAGLVGHLGLPASIPQDIQRLMLY